MKQKNPGLKMVTVGAVMVAGSTFAAALAGASGCSNVIGLNKDYFEEEAGVACTASLAKPTATQHCPSFMKAVPGPYCIDMNEVTWAEYEAIAATSPKQHEGCSQNDMKPGGERPIEEQDAGTDNYPVAFVDWCDAWAYCNAKGKRLCGEIGTGGSRSLNDTSSSCTEDEWFAACSAAGRYRYAEGNPDNTRRCNVPGQAVDGNKVRPINYNAECTTNHPDYYKIMNMNGNVAEWVNQCTFDPTTKAPVTCKIRGGAFADSLAGGDDCYGEYTADVSMPRSFIGIRCCADIINGI